MKYILKVSEVTETEFTNIGDAIDALEALNAEDPEANVEYTIIPQSHSDDDE